MAANEQARKHTWGGNYTLEEIEMGTEKVVTGLRRKMMDSEDESEEDENENGAVENGDEMEVVDIHRKSTGSGLEFDLRMKTQPKAPARPPMVLSDQMRFLAMGKMSRRS